MRLVKSSLVLLMTLLLLPLSGEAYAQCPAAAKAFYSNAVGGWNCFNRIRLDGTIQEWGPCSTVPTSSTGSTNTGADLEEWLSQTRPQMPIHLPYAALIPFPTSNVWISGWMYDENNRHNALDLFGPNPAAFRVDAVADGVVVWKGYMSSPGNAVVIEHTATDGTRYRTHYHHLKDGRDHDLQYAAATRAYWEKVFQLPWPYPATKPANWPYTTPWSEETYQDWLNWDVYQQLAECDYWTLYQTSAPPEGCTAGNKAEVEARWGKNDQGIQVSEGQTVHAGQQIGWAGDTGVHSGGIHLHIGYFRLGWHFPPGEAPREMWTAFDPFGLYTTDNNCYNTDYPSGTGILQHASLLAPVPQDFAFLDWEHFQRSFDYYASFGWFPRTLATGSNNWSWRIGGSFAPDPTTPVVRHIRTFFQHQSDFEFWKDRGWRPQQVSGMAAPDGARYTSVYAPITTAFVNHHKMTESWFNQRFDELYGTHILDDFSIYYENGQLFFSANWVEQPGTNHAMYYGLTRTDLDTMNQNFAAQGFDLVEVQEYIHPGMGSRFAGLWHPRDPHLTRTKMYVWLNSRSYFKSVCDQMHPQGYELIHMSAFKGQDFERYTAIFKAP